MRPWWLRSPAEQDAVRRWVHGEAPAPLLAAQQARVAEREAYADRHAGRDCGRCGGTGRVLVVIADPRGLPLGRTGPCVDCRPEDAQRFVDQIRRSA